MEDETLVEVDTRLSQAVAISGDLLIDHPFVPDYKFTLVHTLNKQAAVLESQAARLSESQERFDLMTEALASLDEAIRLQTQLVERYPEASAYQDWLLQFTGRAELLEEQILELWLPPSRN